MTNHPTESVQNVHQPEPAQGIDAFVPLGDPDPTSPDAKSESSLQQLVTVVLDSASVANRSASVAATSTENLLNAVGDLGEVTQAARTNAWVIIGTSVICGIIAIATFIWASASLSNRLVRADETLQLAGKRVADLNLGVEGLARIETLLESNSGPSLAAVESRVAGIEGRIDSLAGDIRKAVLPKPTLQGGAQGDERQAALLVQIKLLEAGMQNQTRMMNRFAEQVAGIKSDVAALGRMTSTLEAQLALEQARSQQKTSMPPSARPRDRRDDARNPDFIQYPDPSTRKSDNPRQ
jgi:hypothetical protein